MTASAVARLWADRLESGKIDNFNRVPSKLQNDVREILYEDGYDILDDGTVVKKDGQLRTESFSQPAPEPETPTEETT